MLYSTLNIQEARYRRGTARCAVLVSSCYVHEVWELESLQSAKVTFKGIGTGAIRYATYNFLLLFYFNYVYLAPFPRDLFPEFKVM